MAFNTLLDPIMAPLLKLPVIWAVIIVSFFVALLITVVYKYITDQDMMKELKDEMGTLYIQVLDDKHGVELFISILMNFNDDFESQPWKDRSQARSILNNAMSEVMANPNRERALSYCQQLWRLLPDTKNKPGSPDDILS